MKNWWEGTNPFGRFGRMEIRRENESLYRNKVIKVVDMGNTDVEKHRLENEEEHGDYLDFVCE